ncbi:hypothetical protein TIFTF001_030136 [Ficus carica]|uniref:Uncharacterized protein n=1 Tax=Ficus carica TaxID=3494 RepID=A0AA88DT67_FICCA|nr:hypothetical protein TIFTF001_030136 [Ficus carica]
MIGDYSLQQTQGNFEFVGIDDILIKSLAWCVGKNCAKHGIGRATMDEENTQPTVDQHNSFKASCTLNEKEPRVSDQQPTPNASK